VNLWIILSVLFAVLITGTDGITSHVSCAGHGFGAEKVVCTVHGSLPSKKD
jgi:hypothetical protein